MNTTSRKSGLLATGLTLVTGMLVSLIRLVQTANFTPLGGLGLFSGVRLRSWYPFLLPIAIMVATDVALWGITGQAYYSPFHLTRLFVYGSFMLYVVLGKLIADKRSWLWIGGAAVVGSVQFFLITNFGYWLMQPQFPLAELPMEWRYSRDLAGLLDCYVMGLPFFLRTLVGDLAFSGLLFGVHAWLVRPKLVTQPIVMEPAK